MDQYKVCGGVLEGIRRGIRWVLERIYSDYRVLAQLGFDLASAWLALAWLGWAVTIYKFREIAVFLILPPSPYPGL